MSASVLLYLDNRHRLIAVEDLFRGTLDGASVHSVITHRSAAVICYHFVPGHRMVVMCRSLFCGVSARCVDLRCILMRLDT
jgi:hypothetical protein